MEWPWNTHGKASKNRWKAQFWREKAQIWCGMGPLQKNISFFSGEIFSKSCKVFAICKHLFTPLAGHGVLGELLYIYIYICQDICFKSCLLNLGLYFRIGPL